MQSNNLNTIETKNIYSNFIRTRPIPLPEDKDLEIASINQLLDILEANPTDARLDELHKVCRITAWMALILGYLVESDIYKKQVHLKIKLVTLAVDVARISGDSTQYFANLLSAANFFLETNEEKASELYNYILRLPLPYGEDARGASHVSLAQLKITPRTEATFHYELGMRTQGKKLPEQTKIGLAQNLLGAFRETKDLVGLAHISILLKLGNPIDIIEENISQMSFASIVSLTTRLKLLGHESISKQILDKWKENEKRTT